MSSWAVLCLGGPLDCRDMVCRSQEEPREREGKRRMPDSGSTSAIICMQPGAMLMHHVQYNQKQESGDATCKADRSKAAQAFVVLSWSSCRFYYWTAATCMSPVAVSAQALLVHAYGEIVRKTHSKHVPSKTIQAMIPARHEHCTALGVNGANGAAVAAAFHCSTDY